MCRKLQEVLFGLSRVQYDGNRKHIALYERIICATTVLIQNDWTSERVVSTSPREVLAAIRAAGVSGFSVEDLRLLRQRIEFNFSYQPKYTKDDICVFTNRGRSGVKSNDGKKCKITRIKPCEHWANLDQPEYVIEFLDGGGGFRARECELEPSI